MAAAFLSCKTRRTHSQRLRQWTEALQRQAESTAHARPTHGEPMECLRSKPAATEVKAARPTRPYPAPETPVVLASTDAVATVLCTIIQVYLCAEANNISYVFEAYQAHLLRALRQLEILVDPTAASESERGSREEHTAFASYHVEKAHKIAGSAFGSPELLSKFALLQSELGEGKYVIGKTLVKRCLFGSDTIRKQVLAFLRA